MAVGVIIVDMVTLLGQEPRLQRISNKYVVNRVCLACSTTQVAGGLFIAISKQHVATAAVVGRASAKLITTIT